MLRQMKVYAHNLFCLELEKKYILSEMPEKYKNSKIRYTTKFSHYVNSNSKQIKYQNTYAFIDSENCKRQVKSNQDLNIQLVLERIYEIDSKIVFLEKLLKTHCKSINSITKINDDTFSFHALKSITEKEVFTAKEHLIISERAHQLITGEIYKPNLSESKDLFEIKNTSVKNDAKLSNTFSNYYTGFENEIYRSKNEIIASICLRHCGLCYCVEPFYPNSAKRADFGIYCSFFKNKYGKISIYNKPKLIYFEVTGKRDDEKYESNLSQKIEIAKKNHLPLLIIDVTGYCTKANENNKEDICHSILDFEYLCDILTEIYFGLRKAGSEILVPYKAG